MDPHASASSSAQRMGLIALLNEPLKEAGALPLKSKELVLFENLTILNGLNCYSLTEIESFSLLMKT